MSMKQRRKSAHLTSTLASCTEDLDIAVAGIETETDENISAGEKTPDEYWEGKAKGDEAIQLLGQDQEVQAQEEDTTEQSAQQDEFDKAFDAAMAQEDDEDDVQSSIQEGDPGVDQFGSEATKDTSAVRDLGSDAGVDFDGDERLEKTIRDVPGRTERQAKIKSLVARIQNVANVFEKSGRKALAYRLDVICNYLEAKYLNK